MILKSNEELFLKRIGDNLEKLTAEIHSQNDILTALTEEVEETRELFRDIIRYPADINKPPRMTLEIADIVQTVSAEE